MMTRNAYRARTIKRPMTHARLYLLALSLARLLRLAGL